MTIEVTGMEATLTTLTRIRNELPPRLVEMFADTTAEAARPITHVITGALRGSHTAFRLGNLEWMVAPNPGTINPFGFRPKDYGPIEHARGGSHAFYQRTLDERLPEIARDAVMRTLAEFF